MRRSAFLGLVGVVFLLSPPPVANADNYVGSKLLDTISTLYMNPRAFFALWCGEQPSGNFRDVMRGDTRALICVLETAQGEFGFVHESRPSVSTRSTGVFVVYPRELYQSVEADLEERFDKKDFKGGWYVTVDERKSKLISFVRASQRAELKLQDRSSGE